MAEEKPSRSRTSSNSSSTLSLRPPRTPRFAEATAVLSPIEKSESGKSPFEDPPTTPYKPSDVGFGYLAENDPSRHATYPGMPAEEEATGMPLHTPKTSRTIPPPLRSAMKTPGMSKGNPLSPTFREEQILEKHEDSTEKMNAADLVVKTRVRMAKMVLRGVNFSCSLIVLSMLASTFAIFNATKSIPARNNLPAWAAGTSTWPQITLLCIACVSLLFSIVVFWAYARGGHQRAEKTAVYYTVFACCFFVFSIVMWGIGAGILNSSKQNGGGNDIWGWSCKDNRRKQLFENEVKYSLICRLQDWSLICCIIEVVVELFTVLIYGIVFYRYYSKHKLRKSMNVRDKARSDLYLAQLRTQSAPNTPGFTPSTPRFPLKTLDPHSMAEEGFSGTQFAQIHHSYIQPKPFTLQAAPKSMHSTPVVQQVGFESVVPMAPKAPGEQDYGEVPIPGAYASPIASPLYPPPVTFQSLAAPGQAYTSEERIESPPSSPQLPPTKTYHHGL